MIDKVYASAPLGTPDATWWLCIEKLNSLMGWGQSQTDVVRPPLSHFASLPNTHLWALQHMKSFFAILNLLEILTLNTEWFCREAIKVYTTQITHVHRAYTLFGGRVSLSWAYSAIKLGSWLWTMAYTSSHNIS